MLMTAEQLAVAISKHKSVSGRSFCYHSPVNAVKEMFAVVQRRSMQGQESRSNETGC